jgi:hypothetical protein
MVGKPKVTVLLLGLRQNGRRIHQAIQADGDFQAFGNQRFGLYSIPPLLKPPKELPSAVRFEQIATHA